MSAPRVNRAKPKFSCSGLALSMFISEATARAKFASVLLNNPEARKTIGTHVASVALSPSHGVQTAPSHAGHFALHEYVGVNLVPASQIVGAPL